MIKCPACGQSVDPMSMVCTQCRFSPSRENGYIAWAPQSAHAGEGFKVEYFDELARLEADSFWFRSRNALILWVLGRYVSRFDSLMELGCGTGYVLSAIANAYPGAQITGTELLVDGLDYASQRETRANYLQLDARDMPYVDEFDVVGAFDVLEHVAEDDLVLRNIYRALRPGGYLIATVPQHRWLWSAVDESACHVRRYSTNELQSKLRAASFTLVRSTSFVSVLLPAMVASRIASNFRGGEGDAKAEISVPSWLNRIFEALLICELWVIRLGFDFPFGGSRLVVARKQK